MMLAGTAGMFVVVLFAASVQGAPTIDPWEMSPPSDSPAAVPPPSGTPSPEPLPEPVDDIATTVIAVVLVVLGVAILLLLGYLLVRALIRAWRDRPLRARSGGDAAHDLDDLDAPAEDDAAAPVIRRGIVGALRSIDSGVTPADAIIAAWVGLEESAADAGLTRGMSETPSEFALRIITRRAGITGAAEDLLRLYERVRFGGYAAGEADRALARAALGTIEEGWR